MSSSKPISFKVYPKGNVICIDYEKSGSIEVPIDRAISFIIDFCRAKCLIEIDNLKEGPGIEIRIRKKD